MNIFILSRGPQLYSTQSLFKAGLRRRHFVRIIDHMECQLIIEEGHPRILYRGEVLTDVDAIIPRIGSSATPYGASVIQQFEMMGVFTALDAGALLRARNKLRTYQLLSTSDIGMPKTVFSHLTHNVDQIIDHLGGAPLVIKLLKGTHGLGVVLARDKNTATSVIEGFGSLGERVIIQEFIEEAAGSDLRAFVVNGEVVAAMKRQAPPGEFRSNLHRGARATRVRLSPAEEETALRSAQLLGLKVAGVDMLQSARGPLILEVNPSPGLEGIETFTKVNVAGKIIQFIEQAMERKQIKS